VWYNGKKSKEKIINMNCKFCNSGIDKNDKTCTQCGAPNIPELPNKTFYFKRNEGTCLCGIHIDDEIHEVYIENVVCHICFGVFSSFFRGKYVCDKVYPNGQITHCCETVGMSCPHCGAVFGAHEFYHGVYESNGVDFIVSRIEETQRSKNT
jgi:hypothetical protein